MKNDDVEILRRSLKGVFEVNLIMFAWVVADSDF